MHRLGVNRTWLFTWPDKGLTHEQIQDLERLLVQREEGRPIAYLLGEKEFWSLPLKVSEATLIPRPDTETLIEWALELPLPDESMVLDLGTGTGAIALALASERPCWQLEAVDFSIDAVELARLNAANLDLKVNVYHGSWFQPLPDNRQYDLIVSNPPYIDPEDHHLRQGDVRFEPLSALVAENKGLADIESIIAQAPNYLNRGGWLLLEHGYDQAEAIRGMFENQGFLGVQTRRDLGDNPRITGGQWPS